MELGRVAVGGGVVGDRGPVDGLAVTEVGQAAAVVGAGALQDLAGQQVAVAGHGRPDRPGDHLGQPVAETVRVNPGRRRRGEQRVVADGAGQVGVELADGRADPQGRRGAAVGQPGPQPVAGLVEAAGQLGAALQVVGGVVRGGQGDLGDQAEHGRLDAAPGGRDGHLGPAGGQLGPVVGQAAFQHGQGDPVLGAEPAGVDGGQPALQLGQAPVGLGLGGLGQVGDLGVPAGHPEHGGVERRRVHGDLEVPLGQLVQCRCLVARLGQSSSSSLGVVVSSSWPPGRATTRSSMRTPPNPGR